MKSSGLALLALLGLAAAEAQGDPEAGRKAFNRCASCHSVPDPRLRWDAAWIDLVSTSPCAAPAPGASPLDDRRALLAFLVSESAPRLARVDAETPVTADKGTVVANIEEGYLLLVPKDREMIREKGKEKGKDIEYPKDLAAGFRIVWKKDERERGRPVPEGEYRVRRYVISRDDPKTGEWTLWATGEGRAISVKAGQETKVTLDVDVKFETQAARKGTKVTIGGAFKGDRDMGLTILRNKRRLEISWKVLDGKQDLAAGGCAYGAEGLFAGTWDLQPAQRLGSGVAKYFFELAMFKLKGDPREAPIR